MKNYQKSYPLFFFALLFTACTKDIYIKDLVEEKNTIVVNSLMNNTHPLSVTVTKGFLYESEKTIEEIVEASVLTEAKVAVYENGNYIEDLVYQKTPAMDIGEFTASFVPKIGAKYQIEATAEGFPVATSIGEVPKGVDIVDASVKYSGGNSYPFSFTLNDPAEENFYYLKMYFNGYLLDSLTQTRIDKGRYVVEIPEGALPQAERYVDNGYLFKDDALGGKTITISGIAKAGRPLHSTIANTREERELLKSIQLDTTQLFIHLETLSEDAYKFHKSNSAPLQINDDFLNESTTVYSNVENGLGLFAGTYISEVGVDVTQ